MIWAKPEFAGNGQAQKKASGCRTAQPLTLALFPAWGSSAGAGRIPLPGRKGTARK